jgi:hypothetical protein
MTTRGNMAFLATEQAPARAVSSARIDTIFATQDGIVMGVTNISTIEALSALRVADEKEFAPGCLIIPISSVCDALASCRLWQNIGTKAIPVITQIATAV